MPLRELQKVLAEIEGSPTPELDSLLERLQGKPFWCGAQSSKRSFQECCFNHILDLPSKNGQPKIIFDYEIQLLNELLEGGHMSTKSIKSKHLFIKKATGLGITEFCLRFMVWLCCYDDSYRNTSMVVVTGPSIEIAIKLIKRIKLLFEPHEIYFEFKETYLELNGVQIEAYPSHHLDTFRALESPSLILLDEADFFPASQQQDARHVSERYIAKSDPFIILVSTPNAPGGLFQKIEQEPESTCIYKRLKLDYTVGLGKIYTQEEIEKAKASPSFEREYNLRYLGLIGNSFRQADILRATSGSYDVNEWNDAFEGSMGVDVGFGSSNFAITVTCLVDDKIRVLYSEEFERPDHMSMVSLCSELMQRYNVVHTYVDGASPGFISSLKSSIGEEPHYQEAIARYKSQHVQYELNMKVLPINFSTTHKELLSNTKMIFSDGLIAIDKIRFPLLVNALNIANDIENSLQKTNMSNSDSLDSLRLALVLYEYS